MTVEDIIRQAQNLIDHDVIISGILKYDGNQFFMVGESVETSRKQIQVGITHSYVGLGNKFATIDFHFLTRLVTKVEKLEATIEGVLSVDEIDGTIFVRASLIILHREDHKKYIFRGSGELSHVSPFLSNITTISDVIKSNIANMKIHVEATIVGILIGNAPSRTEFYLTDEQLGEIKEPYTVNPSKTIKIEDSTFLSQYTKFAIPVIPSPTWWLHRVRLIADVKQISQLQYHVINVQEIAIRRSNTYFIRLSFNS